jgi:hypothetical protein
MKSNSVDDEFSIHKAASSDAAKVHQLINELEEKDFNKK